MQTIKLTKAESAFLSELVSEGYTVTAISKVVEHREPNGSRFAFHADTSTVEVSVEYPEHLRHRGRSGVYGRKFALGDHFQYANDQEKVISVWSRLD